MTWEVINLISYPSLVDAQSLKFANPDQENLRTLLLAKQNDYDFASDGRSGNRSGGGSRSDCPDMTPPLTALMPISNWGKTVIERPSFWFYVPYSPQQMPIGEFVLQREDDSEILRIPFQLPPETSGFVSFSIPPQAEGLELNQWYRWYFNLYCDRQKSSSPILVEGWVQRVAIDPALQRELNTATSRKDKVYADHFLWYDAVAHLAQLRLANVSDETLAEDWTKLLQAKGVDLELPQEAPLIGSVVINGKEKNFGRD